MCFDQGNQMSLISWFEGEPQSQESWDRQNQRLTRQVSEIDQLRLLTKKPSDVFLDQNWQHQYLIGEIEKIHEETPELKHQGSQIVNDIEVKTGSEIARRKDDYQKNICGYITKKILKQFVGKEYKKRIQNLCSAGNVRYDLLISYFSSKMQRMTGPSHLNILMTPICKEQIQMKQIFASFFVWYLKERYLRVLLLEGKMERKKKYVDYKNKALIYMFKFESKYYDLLTF